MLFNVKLRRITHYNYSIIINKNNEIKNRDLKIEEESRWSRGENKMVWNNKGNRKIIKRERETKSRLGWGWNCIIENSNVRKGYLIRIN